MFIHFYINSVNNVENNIIITILYQLSLQQKMVNKKQKRLHRSQIPKLYLKIKDADLIAKEFSYPC